MPGLATLAVVVVLTCGNRLLTVIYTPEYAKQGNLFALLAVTAGLNAIACFLTYALTAARQFRVQFPISLFCLLSTFALSVILVPRFKLIGAACALLISALILIMSTGAILGRVLMETDRANQKQVQPAI